MTAATAPSWALRVVPAWPSSDGRAPIGDGGWSTIGGWMVRNLGDPGWMGGWDHDHQAPRGQNECSYVDRQCIGPIWGLSSLQYKFEQHDDRTQTDVGARKGT